MPNSWLTWLCVLLYWFWSLNIIILIERWFLSENYQSTKVCTLTNSARMTFKVFIGKIAKNCRYSAQSILYFTWNPSSGIRIDEEITTSWNWKHDFWDFLRNISSESKALHNQYKSPLDPLDPYHTTTAKYHATQTHPSGRTDLKESTFANK